MFTVRQTTSGHTGVTKYLVFNGSRRVSVHAFSTREGAQASADDLNIEAMVKDYAEDPRPYDVRLAEARKQFRNDSEIDSQCSGCGESFKNARGLRVHQSKKLNTMSCKKNN